MMRAAPVACAGTNGMEPPGTSVATSTMRASCSRARGRRGSVLVRAAGEKQQGSGRAPVQQSEMARQRAAFQASKQTAVQRQRQRLRETAEEKEKEKEKEDEREEERRRLQWRIKLPMSDELAKSLNDPLAELFIGVATITLLFCYGVQTCNLEITLDTGQVLNLNPVLLGVEEFLAGVFAVELLLRWWASSCNPAFFINPLTIVDVLCVAPVYIEQDGGYSVVALLRVFRVLRLVRLLQKNDFNRIVTFGLGLKPGTYVPQYWLRIAQVVFTIFTVIWITAGLIYEAEFKANPEQFRNFFDALYFSLTTLTTVGFGDITPVTSAGRIAVSAGILTGVLLIPTQLSALASSLLMAVEDDAPELFVANAATQMMGACQRCGLDMHDDDARFCKRCGQTLVPPARSSSGTVDPY